MALRDLSAHFDSCSLNTATLGHREPVEVVADRVAAAGFSWITPWRREIDEAHPARAAAAIRAAGLRVAAYCRTSPLTSGTTADWCHALDDNKRALEVAAELGARDLVAVVGGLPAESRDLEAGRSQILKGLEALMPTIEATGVRIAIEPLHPLYATDRSLLNTLAQALEWCERLDPDDRYLGITVDAYHVWWDPALERSAAAAGPRVRTLHVCDWLRQTRDPLLDRGMMGDGVIDLRRLRRLLEDGGFAGFVEVEIFSRDRWWQEDPDTVLRTCRSRLQEVC